ncbi:MAG: hypothetical protein JJV93_02240 [Alphaproteobacteria bacterium]|nr:hypothetical protein [Alphaproteobacteria bacterium]
MKKLFIFISIFILFSLGSIGEVVSNGTNIDNHSYHYELDPSYDYQDSIQLYKNDSSEELSIMFVPFFYIFDYLFVSVSEISGRLYSNFSKLVLVLLGILLVVQIYITVGFNLKEPEKIKSLLPTLLTAMIVSTFLGMGLLFPRSLMDITLVPAIDLITLYTQGTLFKYYDGGLTTSYDLSRLNDDIAFFSNHFRDTFFTSLQFIFGLLSTLLSTTLSLLLTSLKNWNFLLWSTYATLFMSFIICYIIVRTYGKIFLQSMFFFIDLLLQMCILGLLFPFIALSLVFPDFSILKTFKGMVSYERLFKPILQTMINISGVCISMVVIQVLYLGFISVDSSTGGGGTVLLEYLQKGDIEGATGLLVSPNWNDILLLSWLGITAMYVYKYIQESMSGLIAGSSENKYSSKTIEIANHIRIDIYRNILEAVAKRKMSGGKK